jgi:Xaa-Pro aminopeptidase
MPLDRTLLRGLLAEEELDALLICRSWDAPVQPNVSYVLGHLLPAWDYSGLFILLPGAGPITAVANEWCPPDPAGEIEVRTYPGFHMRFALPLLTTMLRDLGMAEARIGIERTRLAVDLFDALRAANPGVSFAQGDRVLARLRMARSDEELQRTRGAIRAAEAAVRAAVAALTPGRPLHEVEEAARAATHPEGGRVFTAHLTSYRPDGTELLDLPPRVEAGRVLVLDVGAECGGYRADMARQLVCGAAPGEIVTRLQDVVAMQEAMIRAVRPGQSIAEAYAAATEAAAPWAANDSSFVFQCHGIGLETHEPPRFCSPNKPFFPLPEPGAPDDVPVGPRSVVCLELGVRGAWIEDMFLIEAQGPERLTSLPQTVLSNPG